MVLFLFSFVSCSFIMELFSEKDKAEKLKREAQWQFKVDVATNWQIAKLMILSFFSEMTLNLL